jgi:hypothetical protein
MILFGAVFVPCVIAGATWGGQRRMEAFRDFPARSQPLVRAIKSFEKDHGRPPATLKDLVPKYLASVPPTGMSAYPTYDYFTGADAMDRFAGNPWVLSVSTISGLINFDAMLYFPKQNYDEWRYSFQLERVGDWAYHHE